MQELCASFGADFLHRKKVKGHADLREVAVCVCRGNCCCSVTSLSFHTLLHLCMCTCIVLQSAPQHLSTYYTYILYGFYLGTCFWWRKMVKGKWVLGRRSSGFLHRQNFSVPLSKHMYHHARYQCYTGWKELSLCKLLGNFWGKLDCLERSSLPSVSRLDLLKYNMHCTSWTCLCMHAVYAMCLSI